MKHLFLAAMILSNPAFAGGISGNGGGLWACLSPAPAKEIEKAVLVDFHEAQDQYGRSLVTTSRTDPFLAAEDLESSLRARFPEQFADSMMQLYADVKARIRLVESEIVKIYDVANLVKPKAAHCATGWEYLQFANYTDYNALLISKDYWDSPKISVMDKAGLLWHEVVYRWMRETYKDQNSVRARRIVGVLFSTMSAEEAQNALVEILKLSTGEPDQPKAPEPEKPAFKPVVICLMKNGISHRYFYDYGKSKLQAKSNTLAACQGGGDGFHCRTSDVPCEPITQPEENFTCAVKNGITQRTFTETGRSKFEAEAKVRMLCGDSEDGFHCRSEIECE